MTTVRGGLLAVKAALRSPMPPDMVPTGLRADLLKPPDFIDALDEPERFCARMTLLMAW